MDFFCVHAKGSILIMNSPIKKRISRNYSMAFDIRASKKESLSRNPSLIVRSMGKNNSGSSDSNFSSSSPGNSDQSKAGDDRKGNNPLGGNKYGDTSSPKSKNKPLDWREFRSLLYIHEQAEKADFVEEQDKIAAESESLPLKWAHPISAPENGCLLVATEKLDGLRSFERTVILLLRSGTRHPHERPYGLVLNRPLNKKVKHVTSTNAELATTFAECPLYLGGPLDANMFLLRDKEKRRLSSFEEVIPGVQVAPRSNLKGVSALVKNATIRVQEMRYFIGYAGWQMDQLKEEINNEYWYVAACSANLIFGTSSTNGLWEEILQLMGGRYSELSRKPKEDDV